MEDEDYYDLEFFNNDFEDIYENYEEYETMYYNERMYDDYMSSGWEDYIEEDY